jgi:hypothetical protein
MVAAKTKPLAGEVTINSVRLTLAGVADNEQALARIEEHLRGTRPTATARIYPLPPTSPIG